MKNYITLNCFVAVLAVASIAALQTEAQGEGLSAEFAKWGERIDPDGDCAFFVSEGAMLISVPGSKSPHDLAIDVGVTNAPRVLQQARGDFTIQVQVDGRFAPGNQSTLSGRGGYNGAGLVAVLDARNVVTLARAVIHHGSNSVGTPYANFEIRSDGKLERIGFTGDYPLPQSGPVHLRIERRGQKILGAVSTDGIKWSELGAKQVPANWPQELQVGVVAISTSKEEFNPRFSKLQILKP